MRIYDIAIWVVHHHHQQLGGALVAVIHHIGHTTDSPLHSLWMRIAAYAIVYAMRTVTCAVRTYERIRECSIASWGWHMRVLAQHTRCGMRVEGWLYDVFRRCTIIIYDPVYCMKTGQHAKENKGDTDSVLQNPGGCPENQPTQSRKFDR